MSTSNGHSFSFSFSFPFQNEKSLISLFRIPFTKTPLFTFAVNMAALPVSRFLFC